MEIDGAAEWGIIIRKTAGSVADRGSAPFFRIPPHRILYIQYRNAFVPPTSFCSASKRDRGGKDQCNL
jgi:hypothetical protein